MSVRTWPKAAGLRRHRRVVADILLGEDILLPTWINYQPYKIVVSFAHKGRNILYEGRNDTTKNY